MTGALVIAAGRDGQAPVILTEVGARRLTDKIRGALVVAWELLTEAWEGRVWEPLGYADWNAYCVAELGDLRQLRLPVDSRRELVGQMRRHGMSTRAIASGLGISVGTVATDRAALGETSEPETVVSLDGRRRPARSTRPDPAPAPTRSRADEVVARVAAQADRGLTCRELVMETGWHHGVASGALSRVARQGRIRPAGRIREGYGVYLT